MKRPSAKKFAAALTTHFDKLESKHSRRSYEHDWTEYAAWCATHKLDILALKPGDVQRYMTHLRDKVHLAKPTAAHALSVLRSMYDALVVDGFLPFNPASSVKNIKVNSTPKTPWLDEDKLRQLLLAIEPDARGDFVARRDRLVVLLFIGTGRRRSEVTRMRVEDFQMDLSPGSSRETSC